jgi:hypothetical protein
MGMKKTLIEFILVALVFMAQSGNAHTDSCVGFATIEGIVTDSYSSCNGSANVSFQDAGETANATATSYLDGMFRSSYADAYVSTSGGNNYNPKAYAYLEFEFVVPELGASCSPPWCGQILYFENGLSAYNDGGVIGMQLFGPNGFNVGSDDIRSYYHWGGVVSPGEYTVTAFASMDSNFGVYSGHARIFPNVRVYTNSSIPEPSTLPLISTGLGVIGLAAWRRRK